MPREVKASPRWVPVLMFVLLGLGLVVIFLNYLDLLPGGMSNAYLGIGLACICGGSSPRRSIADHARALGLAVTLRDCGATTRTARNRPLSACHLVVPSWRQLGERRATEVTSL